jgi:polyvinyl alcohol dehydrogenase (cytochrome)
MMRTIVSVVVLVFPALAQDWPMYLRDPAHSSFNSEESKIGVNTLPQLQTSWKVKAAGVLAAAPTISNGALYVGDWSGYFHAIRARDGQELWSQFVGVAADPESSSCQQSIGVSGQAAVDDKTVYVPGGDSAVYAFDRETGEQLWRVPLADPATGAYIWSSITLYNGAIYVGVASLGDCPLVRGLVARIALDDPTKPLIKYLAPEDQVGGGVWSTPAVDAATNTLFVTTGTGDQDTETGLWGGSLLSLDATTLEVKAYFLLPTNSVDDDIEWGSSPSLFTMPDGTPMVAATGKDGLVYALRRSDLQLVWTQRVAVQCICPECGCGSLSTPAFDGKTLYIGAGVFDLNGFDYGNVWALDPASGQKIWGKGLPGTVIAPVTVANGLVYVPTLAGLEIFDAGTGEELWNDGSGKPLYSQAVVTNGWIYCSFVSGDVVGWKL